MTLLSGVLYGGQRPQLVGGAVRWRPDALRHGRYPRDRDLLADEVRAQPEGPPHRGDGRHKVSERNGEGALGGEGTCVRLCISPPVSSGSTYPILTCPGKRSGYEAQPVGRSKKQAVLVES